MYSLRIFRAKINRGCDWLEVKKVYEGILKRFFSVVIGIDIVNVT